MTSRYFSQHNALTVQGDTVKERMRDEGREERMKREGVREGGRGIEQER